MSLLLLPSYELILQANGVDYNFETNHGILYNAVFGGAAEFFPGASFAEQARLFAVGPATKKLTELPPGTDPLLGPTLAKIISGKFAADRNVIILYVCATEDKKELVRLRKFDRYFGEYNTDGTYIKTRFTDSETNIHGAAIYHFLNPDRYAIQQAALALPSLFW